MVPLRNVIFNPDMSTNGSPSDTSADLVTIRTGHSIAPATWVTACFSLGGIAGIIWQAYASAPTIPPTPLGFIWVLSTMSMIALLGAGREVYIREGLRIASEYSAQVPAKRNTVTDVPADRARTSANDKGAPDNLAAAAETVRPVVVATYEIHEAIDSNDPDEEPFELEYLAFHNLRPAAAFNIRIDPIMVAEDDITLFGSAIKLLKRDDSAERQIRGS